jgi:Mg-chelatase subunit ChlI
MARPVVFPFTAIVGQERMKRALILNAVNPQIGGVLIRGERGTAKSTAARALAALLPDWTWSPTAASAAIPQRPNQWCDECRLRHGDGALTIIGRRTPFVDLPISATEDRVVGTLDIEKAIQQGEKHFDPGVLASANRGLLYVDEVNLLDDHVVDLLLDSAAMGVNVVEREGISFSHPARFILVGTMNPEEGDLRPQLLDRFAFAVEISGLLDPRQRVEIMERRMAFEARSRRVPREVGGPGDGAVNPDPAGARARWACPLLAPQSGEHRLPDLIAEGRRAPGRSRHPSRGPGARGIPGQEDMTDQDILLAAELALPHRVKSRAFQESSVDFYDLEERLERAESEWNSGESGEPDEMTESSPVKKNRP